MRAKSHDQRKGQWLINKIRSEYQIWHKEAVELKIWNMENDEFDRLMGDYND